MKEVNGDLIRMAMEGQFDVIMGVTGYRQMGKGIALSIKGKFPEAYKADCETKKAANEKLGTYY